MRRFTSVLVLALTAVVFVAPSSAFAGGGACVFEWSDCRRAATEAYFNDEVGTFRYSLMLDGCDVAYGMCSMKG